MSVSQLLSVLDQEALWFSRADAFEDPYEGRLPGKNIDELAPIHEVELPEYLRVLNKSSEFVGDVDERSQIEAYRKSAFVSCWHQAEDERDVLWRANLGAEPGVVIKSDVGSLDTALEVETLTEGPRTPAIRIGEIRYIDYGDQKLSLQHDLSPIMHKREGFKDEQELRAVYVSFPNDKHPGYQNTTYGQQLKLDWENQPSGKYVDLDVNELVHEIRISPTANYWLSRSISDVVEQYGYDFPVTHSSLRVESIQSRWSDDTSDQ
jgi:hypothetical protein